MIEQQAQEGHMVVEKGGYTTQQEMEETMAEEEQNHVTFVEYVKELHDKVISLDRLLQVEQQQRSVLEDRVGKLEKICVALHQRLLQFSTNPAVMAAAGARGAGVLAAVPAGPLVNSPVMTPSAMPTAVAASSTKTAPIITNNNTDNSSNGNSSSNNGVIPVSTNGPTSINTVIAATTLATTTSSIPAAAAPAPSTQPSMSNKRSASAVAAPIVPAGGHVGAFLQTTALQIPKRLKLTGNEIMRAEFDQLIEWVKQEAISRVQALVRIKSNRLCAQELISPYLDSLHESLKNQGIPNESWEEYKTYLVDFFIRWVKRQKLAFSKQKKLEAGVAGEVAGGTASGSSGESPLEDETMPQNTLPVISDNSMATEGEKAD